MDLGDIYQPCPGLIFTAESPHFSPFGCTVRLLCVGATVRFAPGVCRTVACPQPERGVGKNVLVEKSDFHSRVVLMAY